MKLAKRRSPQVFYNEDRDLIGMCTAAFAVIGRPDPLKRFNIRATLGFMARFSTARMRMCLVYPSVATRAT